MKTRRRKYLTNFGKIIIGIGVLWGIITFGIIINFILKNIENKNFTDLIYKEQNKNSSKFDLKIEKQTTINELSEINNPNSEYQGSWVGLCKKQSIISVEDFKNIVQTDQTLLDYYYGFDWSQARIGNLKEDTLAYVAHRKNGIIGKTSKPIKLPKGDKYITDGIRTVRTYCCNDIVLTPSAGTPLVQSYFIPKELYGESVQNSQPERIYTVSEIDFNPGTIDEPDHPSPIPEPGTFSLMYLGLLVFLKLTRKS